MLKIALILIITGLLGGCGTKGDLYVPSESGAANVQPDSAAKDHDVVVKENNAVETSSSPNQPKIDQPNHDQPLEDQPR